MQGDTTAQDFSPVRGPAEDATPPGASPVRGPGGGRPAAGGSAVGGAGGGGGRGGFSAAFRGGGRPAETERPSLTPSDAVAIPGTRAPAPVASPPAQSRDSGEQASGSSL